MSVRIYLLSVFSFLIFMGNLQAQEENDQFRRDYNQFAMKIDREGNWTEWEETSVSFVFNYGKNNDIALFKGDGDSEIFRRVSPVRKGTTTDGVEYEILDVIDDEGEFFSIQLYGDRALGLKFIHPSGLLLQFIP